MEQAALDSQLQTGILTKYLGALATPSEENKTDSIVLPSSVAATSIILFIADYIADGLLKKEERRVLSDLFGGASSPDLRRIVREVFDLLLPGLQRVPREANFQADVDAALSAMDALYVLLSEHVTNPPPEGPADRIAAANEKVILLTDALARLGILGFHNYLAAVGCHLLVLTERARLSGQAEMKNACQRLRMGLEHAEKTLVEWRKWNDTRFGTQETQFVGGEPTILLITLDGNRYSAEGVRGWYPMGDEGFETFRQEFRLAKDLVWGDVRRQYDLQQADGVLQKWQALKTAWSLLGFCS